MNRPVNLGKNQTELRVGGWTINRWVECGTSASATSITVFPLLLLSPPDCCFFSTSVWMKWHGLPASPQVLIFVLFIVPMWSSKMFRCYNDQELQAAADRKLRTHYLRPTEAPRTTARSSSYSCPLELYKTPLSDEQRDRSLSPWRFV